MATLISSPHLPPNAHPHARSHPHSPLNISPCPSPSLRPLKSTMSTTGTGTATATAAPPNAASVASLQASISAPSISAPLSPGRSFARAPEQRPYTTTLVARTVGRKVREVEGDTKRFADMVADLVVARTRAIRSGRERASLSAGAGAFGVEGVQVQDQDQRKGRSLGGSLAGSWENERAELIVDVPVWSPGSFQDLSTLHALRDRTLAHTHSLLAHLIGAHAIPSSYRLLARSAVTSCSSPHAQTLGPAHAHAHKTLGWGCIRLAPSVVSPAMGGRLELRPKVRRASMDFSDSPATSPGARTARGWLGAGAAHERASTAPTPQKQSVDVSALSTGGHGHLPGRLASTREKREDVVFDEAVLLDEHAHVQTGVVCDENDNDDEEGEGDNDDEVHLKEGYISGTVSDDEDEDADEVVLREIERRGAKEGTAFLMTLFGGPALILV